MSLKGRDWSIVAIIAAVLFSVQIVTELAMGRPPICTCGEVRFWYGDLFGPGLSQHFADWYSFTHISHGFLFYAVTKLLAPRAPFWARFAAALTVEIGWELAENSPPMIERYRQSALAQGYVGDSVLNSVSDALFSVLGFILARLLPVRASIAYVVVSELALALLIRDNLTLNISQLIHPTKALSDWQASGGYIGSGRFF
jgi:hypothetical protein